MDAREVHEGERCEDVSSEVRGVVERERWKDEISGVTGVQRRGRCEGVGQSWSSTPQHDDQCKHKDDAGAFFTLSRVSLQLFFSSAELLTRIFFYCADLSCLRVRGRVREIRRAPRNAPLDVPAGDHEAAGCTQMPWLESGSRLQGPPLEVQVPQAPQAADLSRPSQPDVCGPPRHDLPGDIPAGQIFLAAPPLNVGCGANVMCVPWRLARMWRGGVHASLESFCVWKEGLRSRFAGQDRVIQIVTGPERVGWPASRERLFLTALADDSVLWMGPLTDKEISEHFHSIFATSVVLECDVFACGSEGSALAFRQEVAAKRGVFNESGLTPASAGLAPSRRRNPS